MIGFWSTLGLCSTDGEFRKELIEKCKNDDQAELYEFLQSKLGLPLSIFEVEDIRRLMATDGFADTLEVAQTLGWPNGCPSGVTRQEGFVHPEKDTNPFQTQAVLDVLEDASKEFDSLVNRHSRQLSSA